MRRERNLAPRRAHPGRSCFAGHVRRSSPLLFPLPPRDQNHTIPNAMIAARTTPSPTKSTQSKMGSTASSPCLNPHNAGRGRALHTRKQPDKAGAIANLEEGNRERGHAIGPLQARLFDAL